MTPTQAQQIAEKIAQIAEGMASIKFNVLFDQRRSLGLNREYLDRSKKELQELLMQV